jgi:hypothetical protein
MATPTFDNTDLTSNSEVGVVGQPAARFATATIPGVDGAFVTGFGKGPRPFAGGGYLQADGDTAALAVAALVAAVKARQALADGRTLAAYVHTDGAAHAHCLLEYFEMAGPIEVQADARLPDGQAAGCTARCAVSYGVLEPSP